ncbi:hypothetical protein [Haladaptatus caseinilyticus]|uniref:hypothetical protein n=1 Tax=Haladaptatus caseinilyticus TaxID=2993314 RepID=UPI00224A4A86|nr:hypothetical protein [Haladaptatus caseinilyticus]
MFDTLHHELALFERALGILTLVREDNPIGIRRLSRESGHEHHETRAALRLLEDEGFIEATPDGAVPTNRAGTFLARLDDSLSEIAVRIEALSRHTPAESTDCERSASPELTRAKR